MPLRAPDLLASVQGVLWMIVSCAFYALIYAVVRGLSERFPVNQIVFFRAVVGLLAGRLQHRIEVPVFYFPKHPQRLIRISAQAYNQYEQYVSLKEALVRSSLELW